MLFINTAIALTFLPAILSAPTSADMPSRNDFEDDFANEFSDDFSDDFEASIGKDAPVFADEDDEFEYDLPMVENYPNDFGFKDFDDDMGFSGPRRNKPEYNEYQILVQTGNKWLSGTDSRIFITFGDAHGQSVSTFLSKNNFFDRRLNRNHLGAFKVSTVSQLDDICMITIGNDMKGWYLESVTIKKGSNVWDFPVKQWINRKTGDGGRAIFTLNNCPTLSSAETSTEVNEEAAPRITDSKIELSSESSTATFAPQSDGDEEDLEYGDEEIDFDDIDDNIDLPHPVEELVPLSTPCTKSLLPTPVPDVSTPCTKSLLPTPVPDVSTPCTKSLLPTPVPDVSTPCTKSVLPTSDSYGPIIPHVFPDEDDYPFFPDSGYGPVYTPLPDNGYGPVYTPLPDNGYGPAYPTFPDSDYPEEVYPTPFPDEGYGTPVPLPPKKKCRSKATPVPVPFPKRKCRQKPSPVGYGTPLPELGYGVAQPKIEGAQPGPKPKIVKEADDLSFGDIDDEDVEFGDEVGNSKWQEYRFPL